MDDVDGDGDNGVNVFDDLDGSVSVVDDDFDLDLAVKVDDDDDGDDDDGGGACTSRCLRCCKLSAAAASTSKDGALDKSSPLMSYPGLPWILSCEGVLDITNPSWLGVLISLPLALSS